MPATDRSELEGLVQEFVGTKKFEGCGGLAITEEIKVCVAAHACLLLLHRGTGCYPSLKSVLVYPNVYVAPMYRHIGSGIVEEYHQQRAGESWAHGAVVLAWDVIRSQVQSPEKGHNLVFHEFAHQLDFEDGQADGTPLLGRHEPLPERRQRAVNWARIMQMEFERLKLQVLRGEETLLRDYGATNGAEFFAVATECFFLKANAMRRQHPALYEEMRHYYQQDPASWAGAA